MTVSLVCVFACAYIVHSIRCLYNSICSIDVYGIVTWLLLLLPPVVYMYV